MSNIRKELRNIFNGLNRNVPNVMSSYFSTGRTKCSDNMYRILKPVFMEYFTAGQGRDISIPSIRALIEETANDLKIPECMNSVLFHWYRCVLSEYSYQLYCESFYRDLTERENAFRDEYHNAETA